VIVSFQAVRMRCGFGFSVHRIGRSLLVAARLGGMAISMMGVSIGG